MPLSITVLYLYVSSWITPVPHDGTVVTRVCGQVTSFGPVGVLTPPARLVAQSTTFVVGPEVTVMVCPGVLVPVLDLVLDEVVPVELAPVELLDEVVPVEPAPDELVVLVVTMQR